MSRIDRYRGLAEFSAVAESLSFRKAAERLGVTAPAVGKAIRALEARLGIDLFHRTTRQVVLTEAGRVLLDRLSPATAEIAAAFEIVSDLRDRPAGTLKICVHSTGLDAFLPPALLLFRHRFPEVSLNIVVRDGWVDLLKEGFDAGIRFSELIEPDMKAVRLSGPVSWCTVASPAYLARFGTPRHPSDLHNHKGVQYRPTSDGAPYQWQFRHNDETMVITPPSQVMVNDSSLMLFMSENDQGLVYTTRNRVARQLSEGTLVEVLSGFMPADDSIFVHFHASARRHQKVSAFVDTLREASKAHIPTEPTPRS